MVDASRQSFGLAHTPNAVKAMVEHSSLKMSDAGGISYDELTQGAGGLNAGGAVDLLTESNVKIGNLAAGAKAGDKIVSAGDFNGDGFKDVAIGMPNNMLFQKFMQVIGLGGHLADPRFATYANRKANEDPLLALVEPAIFKMKSGDLEKSLMEAGVPCALVNNFEEVFEHPQIVARGVVQEIEHPRLGTMKVTRNPVLLDHGGPDIARPAPMLGEHSQEILAELGYDQSAIGKLVSAGVTKLAAPPRPTVTAAE